MIRQCAFRKFSRRSIFVPGLFAIEVKNAPADYPVQAEVADFKLGAEYMVSSFSAKASLSRLIII